MLYLRLHSKVFNIRAITGFNLIQKLVLFFNKYFTEPTFIRTIIVDYAQDYLQRYDSQVTNHL